MSSNEHQPPAISPMFTVVIPVFNRVKSLIRALESVAQQDCDNWELIVIDDGSSQDVQRQLLAYIVDHPLSAKMTFFQHEKNYNGARARNTGIKAAKGEYVALLDSDDIWTADKLSQVEKFILSESPDVVYHQYENIVAGVGKKPVPELAIEENQSVADYMFVTNNKVGIQTSTLVVRTEIAKKVLFNEKLEGHQDWDFTLRLDDLVGSFFFIEKPLCKRYLDSSDHVSSKLDLDFSMAFLKEYRQFFGVNAYLHFHSRVLLKKLLKEQRYTTLLRYPAFIAAFLVDFNLVWSLMSEYRNNRKVISKRLKNLSKHVKRAKVKDIIVFGANTYAEEIVSFIPTEKVLAIVDSNNTKQGLFVGGVRVAHPSSVFSSTVRDDTWVVLATDRHAESMLETVREFCEPLSKRVICF